MPGSWKIRWWMGISAAAFPWWKVFHSKRSWTRQNLHIAAPSSRMFSAQPRLHRPGLLHGRAQSLLGRYSRRHQLSSSSKILPPCHEPPALVLQAWVSPCRRRQPIRFLILPTSRLFVLSHWVQLPLRPWNATNTASALIVSTLRVFLAMI